MPYGADFRAWTWDPPWSRKGRFFGSGEVRIAILSLLAEKPRHGYDLMKELETRSGGSYKVSAGTMYPALQQMEDEGLIVSETKDGKRVYQLTELGRQEMDQGRGKADDIWRRTSDWGEWGHWIGGSPLGPLLRATMRAMKYASRDPEMRKRVEEILERARRELEDL
jgi:DNA-binding PadR family transcriptional regulator